MDLQSLGFDDSLRAQADAVLQAGQRVARVVTVDRGGFVVLGERGEAFAQLSGRLRFTLTDAADLLSVGDWVCVEQAGATSAIIHAVLPRRTSLRRKCPGRTVDFQVIAANLDVAFIVQSCHFDFNVRRLERYLVVVREGQIEPVVVLTKRDLVTPETLDAMSAAIRQSDAAVRVLTVSNVTGEGMDGFEEILRPGKTFCLLGSSGVGKTTLINRVLGRDALATRAVSGTGEGVHTTVRRQLHVLDGGAMLVDTPGMRELGLLGTSDGLESIFSDIGDLARGCRFPDCTHTQEPGCAVQAAVAAGDLAEERHRSYRKLKDETDFHDLSYAGKREKDRAFGRFIKSVQKRAKP